MLEFQTSYVSRLFAHVDYVSAQPGHSPLQPVPIWKVGTDPKYKIVISAERIDAVWCRWHFNFRVVICHSQIKIGIARPNTFVLSKPWRPNKPFGFKVLTRHAFWSRQQICGVFSRGNIMPCIRVRNVSNLGHTIGHENMKATAFVFLYIPTQSLNPTKSKTCQIQYPFRISHMKSSFDANKATWNANML